MEAKHSGEAARTATESPSGRKHFNVTVSPGRTQLRPIFSVRAPCFEVTPIIKRHFKEIGLNESASKSNEGGDRPPVPQLEVE